MNEKKIVHTAGNLVVREWHRYACTPCRDGWNAGTLKSPKDGGSLCNHGKGRWEVGMFGPRGGWRSYSVGYGNMDAAILVCDTLVRAANMPEQGVW